MAALVGPVPRFNAHLVRGLAPASMIAALACSGDSLTIPSTGTLEVITSTSGVELDQDGYTLQLDGAAAQPIGSTASMRQEDLASGDHTLTLAGIAANCSVAGENPRPISIGSGEQVTITFFISCRATKGSLKVTSVTTGPSPDSDGYTITLDGSVSLALGTSADITVDGVSPGAHSVGISGVATNCQSQGDNPRPVTVVAGATATLLFSVRCAPPPLGKGSLRITTRTKGSDQDPDGYMISVDGGAAQAIGIQSSLTLTDLQPGSHSVRLLGIAVNCSAAGANPRNASVPDGGTGEVIFDLTCAAVTGKLIITTKTTGSPPDPDGYSVTIEGDAARQIATNASLTVSGLVPGPRDVSLSGLATNCVVVGQNPQRLLIAAGETATAGFAVTCAPTTGGLKVTIEGLPPGSAAAVTVTGPGDYSQLLTATTELANLPPGSYVLTAAAVSVGGLTYLPNPARLEISVAGGSPTAATITYARAPAATVNLRVDGLYLTQSIQTLDRTVPLIQGKNGYLRVFVLANEPNKVTPNLRVRFLRDGVLSSTRNVPAPSGSVPTSVEEATLGSSWNLPVPGSLIQPGLEVLVDVDPDNAIAETNEGDNAFPASAAPQPLAVVPAAPLGIRFVPVRQQANGLQGNVSNANKDGYLNLARRIYPIPGYDADVHAVYTTTTTGELQSDDANGAWGAILSEVDALRVVEGTSRSYYGVVRRTYCCGIAGIGYLGLPTALGYDDDLFGDGRVTAHELGHTWGRFHSPCGNPGFTDPAYPYPEGTIGVYGLDVEAEILRPPTDSDVMGYCGNPWISDYTYKGVLDFRGQEAARTAAPAQLSLLVWGRIVDGHPVLEPAFQLVTRPVLPARPGPYRIEGRGSDGTALFSISFDAHPIADIAAAPKHFAFAVPLSPASAARLEAVHLSGPGAPVTILSQPRPQARLQLASDSIRAQRTTGGVTLSWDSRIHPMLLVRDPDTREVLSFASGGHAELVTNKSHLDIIASDRVRSNQTRVAVSAR